MNNNQMQPKGPPKLTLIKNMNVGDVSMNVNAKGSFSVSTNAKKVAVINRRPKVKPLPHSDGLTRAHKTEFKVLKDEWVTLSLIKKGIYEDNALYKKVRQDLYREIGGRLNRQAKSIGPDGVTSVHEYPDIDFEKGKKFLTSEIGILNGSATVRKDSPDWRNTCLGSIHKRCKELGIPDQKRKTYQKARFGKESLADFTRKELDEMYQYVKQANPSFDIERVKSADTQNLREMELAKLLGELKGKNGWVVIPDILPFDKAEFRQMLEYQAPRLFDNLSDSQFNRFWATQKQCKLKRGSKPKSD